MTKKKPTTFSRSPTSFVRSAPEEEIELQRLVWMAEHDDDDDDDDDDDSLTSSSGADSDYPKPIAGNWGLDGLVGGWTQGIDAVIHWPNNHIYMFRGANYVRYSSPWQVPDPGYPASIAGNWGLDGLPGGLDWTQGIDAALNGTNGHMYFFKEDQYVRYSSPYTAPDSGYPIPISQGWAGLPSAYQQKIDTTVRWPNGRSYFFNGSDYLHYTDLDGSASSSQPIAVGWPTMPSSFDSDLDAAIVWPNKKGYFFKGSEYVRYQP